MNRNITSLIFMMCFSYSLTAYSKDGRISRKVIERSEIPGSNEELQMILIEYPPGAEAPPHIHPVVGLNYIIDGTAQSQYEGEPLKILRAGDTYQDQANRKHLVFKNESKTKKLKFLVTCKIRSGHVFTQMLIKEKDPE